MKGVSEFENNVGDWRRGVAEVDKRRTVVWAVGKEDGAGFEVCSDGCGGYLRRLVKCERCESSWEI